MTIGNRCVWADQFSFTLSDNLTGAKLGVDGGYATISLGSDATIDTTGTLTASCNGHDFVCNITVGYPVIGIYKDSTRSVENLLGTAEEMTWNLNNENAPTTVYLIPSSDYTIDYVYDYNTNNVRYVTENGYVKVSVADTSESASTQIQIDLRNASGRFWGNKSFNLVWEKPEVADEPDTTHLFAGDPSKTTLTMYTSQSDMQYGLIYYVWGKDGKLEEKWADYTFDLELKSDDPSYSIGTAYWNGYGNMQIQNAAPGTGTLTATKGNIRRTLKVVIKRNTMEIYSDPDGKGVHYIGNELYFEGAGSTFYFVPDPKLGTTITGYDAEVSSIASGDETSQAWDGLEREIVENGKALKVTVKQSYLANPDAERFAWFDVVLANGSIVEASISLYPGTLFTNEVIWASRKNATKLRTWDGKILDHTYKVTVKDGNGDIIPSRWIDDDYLMIDTRNVSKGNALKYTITATKHSTTYKTIETTMYIPEYSTYTGTYDDDPTTSYLSTVGQPVTYTDENRTFYYYGIKVSSDLLSFVEDECSTTNPNIEIEFEDYRTWIVAGFEYPYMSGNKCMKLTLKKGINTPQVAIVSATQQNYRGVGDSGKFTNRFLIILIPEWMKDTYRQDTGTRNGMDWTLEDGKLTIEGGSVEAYTSTLEFENRRDEITKLELDSRTSEIGAGAFKDLDHLESVTVPGNTQTIGKNAFEGCDNLSDVTIPERVGKIDSTAFDNTADDLTIHGDAGDTYAETFAMQNDINYESESGTAEGNDLSVGIGKTVGADKRVAVAAVIDNGGNTKASGTVVAAIYYQGRLIATELLDSSTATGKQDRLVMQLPYLQDLDADDLDIQILYLGSNNAPLTEAATQEASAQAAAFYSARTTATKISANATAPVAIEPDENKKFSINYTDVTAGEYVLVAVKSGASVTSLTEDNLLYIQQQTASGTTVSFTDFSLKSYENADVYITSASGTKKIGTITASGKTEKTVTVTASNVTYGTAVTVTAASDVQGAVYSYRYTNANGYDSDKAPTDAGTYTVTATLVSDEYKGSGSATFTISPKKLSDCEVLEIQSVVDSGKAQKPAITVMDGFSKLSADTDFTAAYKDNSAVGTASVTITGKGNYTGTANASFTIIKNENAVTETPGTGSGAGGTGGTDEPAEDENTVTLPNGSTVTTETAEDGSVSISLTDENGKTVANITLPAEPAEGGSFTDVKEGAWYENAVQEAVGYGLFSGTSETKFEPTTGMTRGMLAQVLYNLCGKPEYGESGTFTDGEGWFEEAVDWAAAAGIVSGNGDGTFEPTAEITREQLVVMLYNFAKAIGAENSKKTSLTTFPDGKNVSDWAQNAMQWALANGIVSGSKNGAVLTLNPKATATRAEVATIMVKFVNYLK